MPKVTVRPTRQAPNYKRIAVTGAGGSAVTALSDQSDATYVRRKADGAPACRMVLARPTVPAGCDIATVVPGARLKQPTSRAPKIVTLAMSVPGTGKPKNKVAPTVNGPAIRAGSGTSAYTFEAPAGTGKAAGPRGPWADWLDALAVRVNDGHKAADGNRATIHEVFANLYCAARPTVALATTPATPITTTSYPTLSATFSALVEDWQDNTGEPARSELEYELKLFASEKYTAPGFDPASSAASWSSQGLTAPLDYGDGATPSSETVDEVPNSFLPNGVYRLYGRARRYFAAARFGDWAYIVFTIGVTPCPAPTLTATVDDAGQRVALTATASSTAGAAAPLLSIERSDDAGATWSPVRGATRLPVTFGAPVTIYDHEAARETALAYRVNCEATFVEVKLVSNWRAAAAAGTLTGAKWNLKAPLDATLNWLDAKVDADPQFTQAEDAGVFRPIGRKFPVVISMSLGGADGSMVVTARTSAEWAKLEALRDYAGTLLLESPHGWARYVRIVGRAWSETGGRGAARRKLACEFLEVGAP